MRTRTGLVLLLAALGGCGSGESGNGGSAVAGSSLTGLYESGNGARRNQLCMIEREGRAASFGFVLWGEADRSCGGKGIVRRDGDRLRLLLDGDESCVIDARLEGDRVVLQESLATECARYYCRAGVNIANAEFTRSGGSEDDARRAVDLVGDPLCGG